MQLAGYGKAVHLLHIRGLRELRVVAMRGYSLNVPKVATLALILVMLGVLGFYGYRLYEFRNPSRVVWHVEPVMLHGYIIAAGMVEKDPGQSYTKSFGLSVDNGGCPPSTPRWPVGKAEAYSVEGYSIDPSQYWTDGDYFSIVTPLDPEWIETARQCDLRLVVYGGASTVFSYGASGSKQIRIVSVEPPPGTE